jgi:hypothetical protein
VTAICVQGAILAFLVSCRTEVLWQVAMIIVAAAALSALRLYRRRSLGFPLAISPWKRLWPAGVVLLLVLANTTYLRWVTDERYLAEPKTHIIWHEVLMGILSSSPELSRRYLGGYVDKYTDTMVYEAVIRDLNARNDTQSPATRLEDGRITFDTSLGWGGYDDLVRSLSLRIIRDHPSYVVAGVLQKARDQIKSYIGYQIQFNMGSNPDNASVPPNVNAFTAANLAVTFIVIALGAFICAVGRGFDFNRDDAIAGMMLGSIILLFAAATPAIEPTYLAVGTLFCYMAVPAILMAWLITGIVVFLIQMNSPEPRVTLPPQSSPLPG